MLGSERALANNKDARNSRDTSNSRNASKAGTKALAKQQHQKPAMGGRPATKRTSRTGTGGAVCKGATPSVEQPGGRGFKPWLRSLLD